MQTMHAEQSRFTEIIVT